MDWRHNILVFFAEPQTEVCEGRHNQFLKLQLSTITNLQIIFIRGPSRYLSFKLRSSKENSLTWNGTDWYWNCVTVLIMATVTIMCLYSDYSVNINISVNDQIRHNQTVRWTEKEWQSEA